MNNNKVQNRIAREVALQLSEKLKTKVCVGHVDYRLFNTFSVENLYVEDQKKDTLVYVDRFYADFDFWKFFTGIYVFKSIELDNFYGNLVVDSTGVSNLDFILKAFQKPKKKKDSPSNVQFNFDKIKLINSSLKIYNLQRAALKDKNCFDGNRIFLKDINGEINVDYLKGDSLYAHINNFSVKERSGLTIENIKTTVQGWKKGFRFPTLSVKMPNSTLLMDSVQMTYDSIAGLKDVMNKVKWTAEIKPSNIVLKDLAAFVPNFINMKDAIDIHGSVNGMISSFRLKNLHVHYGNSLSLKTNLDINGLPDIDETFIYADVKELKANKGSAQDLISRLSNKPFVLPKELARLGTIEYAGNISGFFSNLVTYGNISTDVGNLRTDILLRFENNLRDFRYSGSVQSNNFQLGRLLATDSLGKTVFKLTTKGTKLYKKSFQGIANADISEFYLNSYVYRNIKMNGKYDGTGFDGKMDIDDDNLTAHFDGVMDMRHKLPVFNFDLNVFNADIHALRLTNKYKDSKLSFHGNTNMVGLSLDNMNGYLLLDNVKFINNGKELFMSQLLFNSEMDNQGSHFRISSDLINGSIDGAFKYSTVAKTITSLIQEYLPALSKTNISDKINGYNGSNNMNIDLTMSDTKILSEVLELPFTLDGNTTVKGYIDEIHKQVDINAETPFLSFGKRKIQDIKINLNNPDGKLNLSAVGNTNFGKSLIDFNLKAAALNDSLYTQFGWHNSDSVVYAGELQAYTKFAKQNNLTSAVVNFLPTQVIAFDSIWNIYPSQVVINPDTTFDVRSFRIQNNNQYILLDGIVSKKETDVLQAQLNNIDLDFILGLVNFNAIAIAGNAKGTANIYGILKQPIFEANIEVKKALLNNAPVGDAYLYSGWDQKNKELLVSGTFKEGDKTLALGNGIYSIKNDSVDFIFDADGLNLAFLQPYLSTIVKNVSGLGRGSVRMFGKTKDIGFEGSVLAENAKLTVDFLKTTYSFSDSIKLTRKSITMKDITIYDEEKNAGKLDGTFTHDGSFKDIKYDFNINAHNMMAINMKSTDNDYFYGKAYATGDVHIYGDEVNSYIKVKAMSRPGTKVYISVGGASVANTNDFITFVNKNDTTAATNIENSNEKKSSTNLYMTLLLDVTPDADIQLIISPQQGDMIDAKGNGNLRLEYDSNADMKLYGDYTIDKGNYLFTLQNFLTRQFKIDKGSSISWSGDIMRAQLDIRAIYPLTASLHDLMDASMLSSYQGRTSVPVNCILNISDDLNKPAIKFGIDLPSSDETLKMLVHNVINTEDMLNQQMVYLLLLNKFYTPDFNKTSTNFAATTGDNTISLGLNTAVGQLNRWLSQLTSNNFKVGFNVRSSGYGTSYASQEYESQIMYQPNKRIIVNGNVGYRNDNLSKNKIIGDFDFEYLFSESGKWRLKAYNHTVDRYSLRNVPFIQGVGVVYQENFNSWSELWKRIMNKKQTDTIAEPMKNDTTIHKDHKIQITK